MIRNIYNKNKKIISVGFAIALLLTTLIPDIAMAWRASGTDSTNENQEISAEYLKEVQGELDTYVSKTKDLIAVLDAEKEAGRVSKSSQYFQLELFSLHIKYGYSLIANKLDENEQEKYKSILKDTYKFNDDYSKSVKQYKDGSKMSGEEPKINKEVLDNLKVPLESALDLTNITGGGTPVEGSGQGTDGEETSDGTPSGEVLSTTDETERWLRDNKDDYKKLLGIHQNLIELYSVTRESGVADTMKSVNDSWSTKFEELLNAAGLGSNFDDISDVAVNVDTNSDTAIIDIWDAGKNDFTEEYLELLAWTANFTPFETNLYDNNIKYPLSTSSMKLLNKYGAKRTPVYTTTASKGVVAGLKSGAPYQMQLITLNDFVEDFNNKQMAFFIKNITKEDIEKKKEENATESSTAENEEDSSNANEDTDTEKAVTVQSTISKDFIGPVYVQSGSSTLGLKDIDTLSEEVLRRYSNPIDRPTNSLLGDLNVASYLRHIDLITSNHLNMNYVLMSNSLDNGTYTSGALKTDLNRPLYLDFLGNIITESGYVVVPAGANYTYYTDGRGFPIFNAMFLNGYPEASVDGEGKIILSKSEKDKFVFLKGTGKNNYKFAKINKIGNKSSKTIQALKPKSEIEYKDGSTDLKVDFMDPIQDFIDAKKSYKGLISTSDSSNELLFINRGLTLTKRVGTKDRMANLQKISSDGRGVDWIMLMDINKENMKSTSSISRQLMVDIATTLKDTSDIPQEMILSDELPINDRQKFKDDGSLTSIFGQLFEGIHNRLFASAQNNYLLFTPTLGEIPVLKDYGLIAAPITIVFVLLTFVGLVVVFGLSVFNKVNISIQEILVSIVALSMVGVLVLYGSAPLINILYNKPAQSLLRDEMFMYVLEDVEGKYKDQNPTYFDEIEGADFSGNAEILLEKVSRDEALDVRRKVTNTPETFNMFYMPEFDSTPTNVIEDKVFLRNKELLMSVSDLLEINQLEDKVDDLGNIRMEHEYYGGGEIAYYMPYFNITESLAYTINSFSEGSKTAYQTLGYQRGFSKSTGRASSYFKSILFIAPELTEQYTREAESQYARNFYRIDPETGAMVVPDEENQDEETTTEEGTPPLTLDNIDAEYTESMKSAILFLSENMGGDLQDWLGLKRVLFMTDELGPFSAESETLIRNTKWYPREHRFTREEVIEKIYKINKSTKNFVISKILPISSSVSDDTIVKLVSLYATMEYNKEFSTMDNKLYPTVINSKGLSNDYLAKTVLVPQQDMYKLNNNQLGLYLAEEASWPGLLLASLIRVISFIRMILRILIVEGLLISLPFVVYYLYVMRRNVYSRYLWGALTTCIAITMIYLLDIGWYKASYSIVNNLGTVNYMLIAIIPELILTSVVILAFMAILSDVGNFGYSGYKDLSTKMWRGFSDNSMETDEETRKRLEEEGFDYDPLLSSDSERNNDTISRMQIASEVTMEDLQRYNTKDSDDILPVSTRSNRDNDPESEVYIKNIQEDSGKDIQVKDDFISTPKRNSEEVGPQRVIKGLIVDMDDEEENQKPKDTTKEKASASQEGKEKRNKRVADIKSNLEENDPAKKLNHDTIDNLKDTF